MYQAPEQQPIDLTQQLSNHAYYQLIATLYKLLPPPVADTAEALLARNEAAIARIAAMAPVNADEADLAAHCVIARAQTEDVLLQIRAYAGDDIRTSIKLNAQYALMARTAIAFRNQLMRLQAARHKREANSAAANADEWSGYVAVRQMQRAAAQAGGLVVQLRPAGDGRSQAQAAAERAPAQAAEPSLLQETTECLAAAPEQLVVPAASTPLAPGEGLGAEQEAVLATYPAPPIVLAAAPPPPRAPAATEPTQRRRGRAAMQTDEERDLAAEADQYALIYPYRAGPIRQHGGLPPDYDYGPPDDDLVRAIVRGTSPALRALDRPAAPAG